MKKSGLNGKTIAVGITGGIACYKVLGLIKELRKNGANVQVMMTEAATHLADIRDFEKIHKLKDNQTILEPLDVKSALTKNKNFKIGNHEAVDYQIDRNFSAPVGPAKEFARVYEINKEGTVLKFSAYSQTLDQLIRFNDSTLSLIITSLSFN